MKNFLLSITLLILLVTVFAFAGDPSKSDCSMPTDAGCNSHPEWKYPCVVCKPTFIPNQAGKPKYQKQTACLTYNQTVAQNIFYEFGYTQQVKYNFLPFCFDYDSTALGDEAGPSIITLRGDCSGGICKPDIPGAFTRREFVEQYKSAAKMWNCLCPGLSDKPCKCSIPIRFKSDQVLFKNPYNSEYENGMVEWKAANNGCEINCSDMFIYINNSQAHTQKNKTTGMYQQFPTTYNEDFQNKFACLLGQILGFGGIDGRQKSDEGNCNTPEVSSIFTDSDKLTDYDKCFFKKIYNCTVLDVEEEEKEYENSYYSQNSDYLFSPLKIVGTEPILRFDIFDSYGKEIESCNTESYHIVNNGIQIYIGNLKTGF